MRIAGSGLVGVLALTTVASAGPLEQPAFTATPAELLAAARAAPAGDWPMILLRDEREVSYDARGRATVREHQVFAIRSDDGVIAMRRFNAEWHASYQDRPVLRARVIGPGGDVSAIDPADVVEVGHFAPGDVHDVQVVEAMLDRLGPGSVVETEIVTTDREPLPGAGHADVHWIGGRFPTLSVAVSYAAPAGRKLRVVSRKLPPGVRSRHAVAGGRERWSFELASPPLGEVIEAAVPDDVPLAAYLGATPAASWAAVARDYRARIDRRIADGPVELPPGVPRTATRETIDALVAWLRREVAYTGDGFGRAPYTPSPPAETVQRRRGGGLDCATLLIALLRRAGIRADLVLLATEGLMPLALDADLPGLTQASYVVVRARLAGKDIWIDPIERLLRAGALREEDQGRRALVIADETTALSTTPMSKATDNVLREVRRYAAAELGAAQLTAVTRGTGVFEVEQRGRFYGASADEINDVYREVARRELGGTLRRVTSTTAGDLATPFEATVEVDDADRVYSDHEAIAIRLSPAAVLRRAPDDEDEDGRRNDFVWLPHIHEIENRITVPDGFTLPAAEPEHSVAIGTARFTEAQQIDGRTLIVTLRFETDKPRLSPAELAQVQAGVDLLSREPTLISVPRTSFALAAAGKLRDALAEAQRMIALHPREAAHRAELAVLLTRAGAGEAGRREAQKAVEIAPRDADPLAIQAWVLIHDRFGREYTYDWDRAGAIAALRKARLANPGHVGAAALLARVLAHDAAGAPFEHDADLRGAIASWRDALAMERSAGDTCELAQALLWAGQPAEAEAALGAEPLAEDCQRWHVVAAAEAHGTPAAIKAAEDLQAGDGRARLLLAAGQVLLAHRRYPEARALLAASGIAAQELTGWTDILAQAVRHPDTPSGSADPRAAIADYFQTIADPERRTTVFWDPAVAHELRAAVADVAVPTSAGLSPSPFLGDVLQSSSVVHIEGDLGVWRADVQLPLARYQIYLALDHGIARVIGLSSSPAAVGRYILALDPRDAAGQARARRLLDWMVPDLVASATSGAARLRQLWGHGVPSSADAVQLAAAVLAIGTDPDRAIALARRCPGLAPVPRLACREVVMAAYDARRRWRDLVTEVEAALVQRPDLMADYVGLYARGLRGTGRFDDADRAIDAVLARDPDHHDALVARYRIALGRGDRAEAVRRADDVVRRSRVTPDELADAAWFRLVEGSDLPAALELARRAVQAGSGDARTTLAAIEAELGDLGRAMDDARAAMSRLPGDSPTDAQWYVAARIYEQLGLTADAAAIYTRIARSGGDDLAPGELARHRLAALRRTP